MIRHQFLYLALLSVLLFSSGGTLSSCGKNYNDDFDGLADRVTAAEKEAEETRVALENIISKKLTITDYTELADGWTLSLSNGTQVDIHCEKPQEHMLIEATGDQRYMYLKVGGMEYKIPLTENAGPGISSVAFRATEAYHDKGWLEAPIICNAQGEVMVWAPVEATFRVSPANANLSKAVYQCTDLHTVAQTRAAATLKADCRKFENGLLTMSLTPTLPNRNTCYAATLEVTLGKQTTGSDYFVLHPLTLNAADVEIRNKADGHPAKETGAFPCNAGGTVNLKEYFNPGFARKADGTGTFASAEALGFDKESIRMKFEMDSKMNHGYTLADGVLTVAADATDCKLKVTFGIDDKEINSATAVFKTSLIPGTVTVGSKEKVRIACVGNSITAGSGVADSGTNGYPAQLEQKLGSNDYQVVNCGCSGATMIATSQNPYMYYTTRVNNEVTIDYNRNSPHFDKALNLNPHIVVIKLGTNDSQPKYWERKDEFAENTRLMIKRFKENAKDGVTPIFYLCYPCMTDDTNVFGIKNTTIENEVIPEILKVAHEEGANIIDLHYGLLDPTDDFYFKRETDSMINDHVHPNSKGAGLLAQKVCEALRQTLTVVRE